MPRPPSSWFRRVALFAALAGLGTAPRLPAQDPDLEPYLMFLEEDLDSPVDYVMGLFESYHVVILCERDHRDMSQYDLLFDLASDPRFVERVGHICTEIGTRSREPDVVELLQTPGLSDAEVEARRLDFYRNLSRSPVWEKYNLFDFLGRLYRLNETLKPAQRVLVHPSDMKFQWEGMTPEEYRVVRKTLGQRDRIMADHVLETWNALQESEDPRKKLLVIMNYRHAFNDFGFPDGSKGDNVGRYLFEELPDQVANVWLNFTAIQMGSTDRQPVMVPTQEGRWDAAFEFCGNPSVGFDYADTPFGEAPFDLFPKDVGDLQFQDVFTGMIFYKPLREFRLAVNIPGLFDEDFTREFVRRTAIAGEPIGDQELATYVERFSKVREFCYDEVDEWQAMIDRWLEGAP